MYSDENKSSALAKYLNVFDYVLIDTCSLMDESFPVWMDILRGSKAYRKPTLEIIIPRRCYDELKKHARDRRSDSRRIDAKRALRVVRHARWTHLLQVSKKDKTENFADNAIYVKVSNDRLFARILIITQDKKLASDLRALNLLKSQSGKPLEVSKLIAGGRLVPNKGEETYIKEQKGPGAPFKAAPNTAQPASSGSVEAILQADARLSAVISNPNYPEERKREDAIVQLKALQSLPAHRKAQLHLLVPEERLKELFGEPRAEEKKSAPAGNRSKAPTQEKPKKPEATLEEKPTKPTASKTVAPKVSKTPQKTEEACKTEPENLESAPKKPVKKTAVKKAEPEEEAPETPAKPVKKTTAKKAEKPAEETEEAAAKSAKKAKAKPVEEEAPAAEPAPVEDPLEVAKKAEKRLRANITNPNYDLKKKHRDAKRQIALLETLTDEQRATLHFSVESLEEWMRNNPLPDQGN